MKLGKVSAQRNSTGRLRDGCLSDGLGVGKIGKMTIYEDISLEHF